MDGEQRARSAGQWRAGHLAEAAAEGWPLTVRLSPPLPGQPCCMEPAPPISWMAAFGPGVCSSRVWLSPAWRRPPGCPGAAAGLSLQLTSGPKQAVQEPPLPLVGAQEPPCKSGPESHRSRTEESFRLTPLSLQGLLLASSPAQGQQLSIQARGHRPQGNRVAPWRWASGASGLLLGHKTQPS